MAAKEDSTMFYVTSAAVGVGLVLAAFGINKLVAREKKE